ncbi:molybdenum cofactor biosynthesis protein MoaE [Desulfonatronovibrio hydrogenovorans]|uniref:molybdenum cofactor biosynthesis protein MoaE n=1 Tax=Desulfonatronovibrio hydrogenovorans TaxID=53245 RepID=UPI000490BF05|nr:molybdenum cofactor biosynthesis protein MoaE [Desulfonatronovibrio hydrogenovorans]
MDISKTIADLKKEPGFSQNVGMLLVHNGVVRAWSRKDRSRVSAIEVTPDYQALEEIRKRFEKRPGIFRIVVKAARGLLKPGDDLLFIIVAGDIRENVKPVLADILDTIKRDAVVKREIP